MEPIEHKSFSSMADGFPKSFICKGNHAALGASRHVAKRIKLTPIKATIFKRAGTRLVESRRQPVDESGWLRWIEPSSGPRLTPSAAPPSVAAYVAFVQYNMC